MEDVYMLSDGGILKRMGEKLKANRLKQNITQQSLAEASGVPLSTLKRFEKGEIGSFPLLLRLLRELGMMDLIQPLTEEEQLSPQEYYELMNSSQKRMRKRAVAKLNIKPKEVSAW